MKIIFDLNHPAQVNFFRITIYSLLNKGHRVYLSVLDRGCLRDIAKREFPDVPIYVTGKHRGNCLSVILEANIAKFFRMFRLCFLLKPDIGVSTAGFVMGLVFRLMGRPNIQFNDDPERKTVIFLQKKTANILSLPIFCENQSNVRRFGALKEWAYLSPQYFAPDINVLKKYDLQPYNYLFVREVSNGSLNYKTQESGIISKVADRFPSNIKVLLSLEDKKSANTYPLDWILLEEPIEGIHSLIYYSKYLISSGDSMPREAAVLGVPAIYCGVRDMKANRVMVNEKMLIHCSLEACLYKLKQGINDNRNVKQQEEFRQILHREWDDVNEYIESLINEYK